MQSNKYSRQISRRILINRRRRRLSAIASVLAAVVVFAVAMTLMQPANTMTTICGLSEHTHTDACYTSTLTCTDTSEDHEHTSACYTSTLTCGLTEHTHTESCYPQPTMTPIIITQAPATEPNLQETAVPAQNEPTQAPADEPTAEPAETAAPAAEETAAPTDEPTAEPDATDVAEATATPEATSTPEPTVEATATPEPTAEPTPEPTATRNPDEDDPGDDDSPVRIISLTANHETSITSAELVFNFEATGAEGYSWVLTANNGYREEGRLRADAHTITFSQLIPGNYTLKLTATATVTADGAESTIAKTKSCKVKVIDDPEFEVKATTALSGFAGESVSFHLSVSDNDIAKAAKAHIEITQKGTTIYESNTFQNYIAVTPVANEPTELQIKVTLTDEFGRTATAQTGLPIAIHETENEKAWKESVKDVKLTGVWQDDLLAIARSQLGYTESQTDFIIKEDGEKQGWTRYGAKAGLPYEEWCCMYVSFCLDYANVPTWVVPRVSNQQRMRSTLISRGFYISVEDGDYEPQPGDLIFFDHDVNPWDEGHGISDHIGIVTGSTASKVYTIEGNHTFKVAEFSYDIDFPEIVGYCPLSAIYAANEAALAAQEATTILEGDDVTIQALEGELPTDAQIVMVQLSEDTTASLISDYIEEEVVLRAAPRMMSMSALPAAAPSQTGSVSGSAAFDIGIMDGGAAYTESGSYAVTVYPADGIDLTALLPDGASMTGVSYTLTHIHDGAATQIPVEVAEEDGVVDSFTFVTDSFSPFVLQFTVDYEYTNPATGDVTTYAMAGLSDMLLSDLFAVLGIDADVADVTDVSFTDDGLLAIAQEGGDWRLTSLQSFTTTETLTVTMLGGQVYEITVTDDAAQDITSLLTDAEFKATKDEDGKYVVVDGKAYEVTLKFQEDSNGTQFEDYMCFPLPSDFKVDDTQTTITLVANEGGIDHYIQGNKLTVIDNVVYITVNTDDPNYSYFAGLSSATINCTISGKVNEDTSVINWTDTIFTEFTHKQEHFVQVEKSVTTFDKDTGRVTYQIKVTSTGENSNVLVDDKMANPNWLTIDQDSFDCTPDYGGPNWTDDGFNLTIPSMKDGDEVIITYSGDINTDAFTSGNWVDTNNNVEATPEDGETSRSNTNVDVTVPGHNKRGEIVESEDGIRLIKWTVTTTFTDLFSLFDTDINDTWSGDNHTYAGDGIEVEYKYIAKDGTSTTSESSYASYTWDDGNLSVSDNSWNWHVPSKEELGVEDDWTDYEIIITYYTEVDASEIIKDIRVSNTERDDNGGETGEVVVGPEIENTLDISKVVKEQTQDSVTWEVVFTVPAIGLDSAVLTDTLPGDAYNNEFWQWTYLKDTLKEFTVEGLLSGESYEHEVNNYAANDELVITFYKTVDGEKVEGLLPTENGYSRVITVTIVTETNQDWLEQGYNNESLTKHVNKVKLNANKVEVRDSAEVVYRGDKFLTKELTDQMYVDDDNGERYPLYQYTITITGAEDDFDVVDVHDPRLVLGLTEHSWYFKAPIIRCDSWNDVEIGSSYEESDGQIIFHVTKDMLGKDENGNYYKEYKIIYYLTARDAEALKSLQEEADLSNEGKVELENTASSQEFGEDSATVEYEHKVFDKTLDNLDDLKAGRTNIAEFTLNINPEGYDLDETSDYFTLTDELTNLSVDYASIQVEPSNGATWQVQGSTITFRLPDETPLVITYKAIVNYTGNTFDFTNEATIFGQKVTIHENFNVNAGGGGGGITYAINLYKQRYGETSEPLSGAVFGLFYSEDLNDPVLNKDDKGDRTIPATYTTDENGLIYVVGRQDEHGWTFKPFDPDKPDETTYYLRELTPPDGYVLNDTWYEFKITSGTKADYGKRIYLNGDTIRVNNTPEGGIELRKYVLGVELTKEQQENMVFTVTNEAGEVVASVSLAEFTDGKYKIKNLPAGKYTVTETCSEIDGYTRSTSYMVDGADPVNGMEATATIVDPDVEVVVTFSNRYKAEVEVEPETQQLNVTKKWYYGDEDLSATAFADSQATVQVKRYVAPVDMTILNFRGSSWPYPDIGSTLVISGSDITLSPLKSVNMVVYDNEYPWGTKVADNNGTDDLTFNVGDYKELYVFLSDDVDVDVSYSEGTTLSNVDFTEDTSYAGETATIVGNGSKVFFNLPVFETKTVDGEDQYYYYKYYVVETAPTTGFTTEYSVNGGKYVPSISAADAAGETGTQSISVRNTIDEYTTSTVTKKWDVPEGTNVPTSVTVKLLANGKEYSTEPLTLSAGNGWTRTVDKLPTVIDKELVTYTWQEVKVNGYISTVEVQEDGSYLITNTQEPRKVTVDKTWTLASDDLSTYLAVFSVVTWEADGTYVELSDVQPQVIRSDATGDALKITFTDLPATGNLYVKEVIYQLEDGTYSENAPVTERFFVEVDERTISPDSNGAVYIPVTFEEDSSEATVGVGNKYLTGDISLTMTGKKIMEGKPLTQGDFNFKIDLLESDGNWKTMATGTNDADGTITFGEFALDEGTHTLKVYEVRPDTNPSGGITYDETEHQFTITVLRDPKTGELYIEQTDKDDFTIVNGVLEFNKAFNFTNKYEAKGEATISGTKTLENADLQEGQFAFQLINEDNAVESAATNDASGAFTFDKLTFTLDDLDKNEDGSYATTTKTYTVQEVIPDEADENGVLDGISYDTVSRTITLTLTDNGDGTIEVTAGDAGTTMSFTNTYAATGTAIINVKKELDGRDVLDEDAFEFELTAGTENDTEGYEMPESTSVTLNKENLLEGAFEAITFTKAGDYTFTVTEKAGTLPGVTYDTEPHTVTINVTDDGKGTLVTAVTYEDGGDGAATITNTYEATGDIEIPVAKVLDGRDWQTDDAFTFTITAEAEDAPMPETAEVTITDDDEGHASNFGKIAFTLADVGKKYVYTVTEKAESVQGIIYDDTVYVVTLEVSDNGDGTLNVVRTQAVNGEEAEEITFSNEYKQGSAQIAINKELAGDGDDKPTWPADAEAVFTLTAADGTPMPENTTVTINEAGPVNFGTINFTSADVRKDYTYTIVEESAKGFDEADGWELSNETITAVVKVDQDENGEIKATVTYTVTTGGADEGTVTEAPTITNTRHATEVTLEVKKALNVYSTSTADEDATGWPKGGTATFTLAGTVDTTATVQPSTTTAPKPTGGETENPAVKTLTEPGDVTFGPIEFTEPGTYVYTITEDVSKEFDKEDGWVADPGFITATVVVTRADDGSLSHDVTYSPEDKTITNKKLQSLSFSKVWWSSMDLKTSMDWPADETITVTITSKDDSEFKLVYELDGTTDKFTPTDASTGMVDGRDYTLTRTLEGDVHTFTLAGKVLEPDLYYINETEYNSSTYTRYYGETADETTDGLTQLSSSGDDAGAIINVESKGYSLPSTGGSGTWAYTLIGAQLMALAGALLLARRRFGHR